MTNAYFESAVASSDGNVLTVKNKDGEKKAIVTSATAIAAAAPADKAELKPGAQIIIFRHGKTAGRHDFDQEHVCRPRSDAGDVRKKAC
jgi:hypothetical protein